MGAVALLSRDTFVVESIQTMDIPVDWHANAVTREKTLVAIGLAIFPGYGRAPLSGEVLFVVVQMMYC